MNLKIMVLHLNDGVPALANRKSLAINSSAGGASPIDSAERLPHGYLIGNEGKFYVIHDNQVMFTEVIDIDRLSVPAPNVTHTAPAITMDVVSTSTVPITIVDAITPGVPVSEHELRARAYKEELIRSRQAQWEAERTKQIAEMTKALQEAGIRPAQPNPSNIPIKRKPGRPRKNKNN